MRLIECQQRAHKLQTDAEAIRRKAKDEGRKMNGDEIRRVNMMLDESNALDNEIIEIRVREDRDRQLGGGPLPNRDQNTDHGPGVGRDLTDVHALRSDERMVDWVRANDQSYDAEYEDLTFGGFLRAMVCGPRNDVERRALAEGTDSAGGYTVPSITSGQLVDALRAASVTLKAGAQIVPLESDSTTIARIATDPTVEWLAENAVQTASDPTFAGVIFVPKTLRALVRASRELVEDSVNIEAALQKMFVGALSVELDRAALYGSGTGAEPQGVKNMTGIGSVQYDANGTPMLESTIYPAILDTMYETDMADAFGRYLSPDPAHRNNADIPSDSVESEPSQNGVCDGSKTSEKEQDAALVTTVTDREWSSEDPETTDPEGQASDDAGRETFEL